MGLVAQLLFELLEVPHRVFFKEVGQGFRIHRFAIDGEALVDVGHLVARHTHHPLDVVHARLWRVAKYQHIAAHGPGAFRQPCVDDRQPDTVREFVHQNQITDQQGRDHGARRDLEGLKQNRAQKENGRNHGEQARRPVQPPGLHEDAALGFLHIHVHLLDPHAIQFSAPLGGCIFNGLGCTPPAREKINALRQPVNTGDDRRKEQEQRKVALDRPGVPGTDVTHKGRQHQRRQNLHELHQSSTCKMARNAS